VTNKLGITQQHLTQYDIGFATRKTGKGGISILQFSDGTKGTDTILFHVVSDCTV